MLALLRARSPILASFALSVFSDAARFRVKRVRGELGVGRLGCISGRTCFKEPRRLESVEMLTGDRGVSIFEWRTSVETDIMIDVSDDLRRDTGSRYRIERKGNRGMKPQKSMNGLLVG